MLKEALFFFETFVLLAGGVHFLTADERSPELEKSEATPEESHVFSKQTSGVESPKAEQESESSRVAAKSAAELHPILAKWRKRVKRTTAVRVSWDEEVRIAPGGIVPAEIAVERGFPTRFSKTGAPASEISFNYQAQLLLDGDRIRYETRIIAFDSNFDAYFQPYTSSFDGESSRMLFSAGKSKPSGSIRQEQHNVDARNYVLRPLFFFLRPLNPIYATLDEESLEIATPADSSEADKAIVLKQHEESVTNLVWLDDEMDYVVTRWEQHVNRRHLPTSPGNVLAFAADIKYSSDPDFGHVPVSWTIMEFGNSPDDLNRRYEASDVKYELLQSVPQSEFALEFPKGAEVYDQKSKRTTIAGRTDKWLSDGRKSFLVASLIVVLGLIVATVIYRRTHQDRN